MPTAQQEREAIDQVRKRGLATHNDPISTRWIIAGLEPKSEKIAIAVGDSVHDALANYDIITAPPADDPPNDERSDPSTAPA